MEAIEFQEIKIDAGWIMIRPDREGLAQAMAFLRRKKDRAYDLIIKEHRKRRSLDANAYAWVLIHRLAEVMRMPPVEVYRQAIRDVGSSFTPLCVREKDVERVKKSWAHNGLGWFAEDLGPSQVPGCRNLAAYHGSSVYDTAQMSRLIENLVQDCKALGIETLSPEKLSAMTEAWDA